MAASQQRLVDTATYSQNDRCSEEQLAVPRHVTTSQLPNIPKASKQTLTLLTLAS